MKAHHLFLLLLAGAVMALLALGCSKKESTQTTDQEEINGIFSENGDEFDAAIRDESDAFYRDANAPRDSVPFRRYGHVTSADINVEVHEADSTHTYRWAVITRTVNFAGTINVWPTDTASGGSGIVKNFTDQAVRYGYFEQTRRMARHRGWELKSISLVQIKPEGGPAYIDSVHVTSSAGVDRWFRNPAELIPLDSVADYAVGDSVTVSAFGPGGNLGVLHRKHARVRMTEGSAGLYQTGFRITADMSLKCNKAVDMVSHGTVYDSTAAYGSECWGVFYRRR